MGCRKGFDGSAARRTVQGNSQPESTPHVRADAADKQMGTAGFRRVSTGPEPVTLARSTQARRRGFWQCFPRIWRRAQFQVSGNRAQFPPGWRMAHRERNRACIAPIAVSKTPIKIASVSSAGSASSQPGSLPSRSGISGRTTPDITTGRRRKQPSRNRGAGATVLRRLRRQALRSGSLLLPMRRRRRHRCGCATSRFAADGRDPGSSNRDTRKNVASPGGVLCRRLARFRGGDSRFGTH